MSSLQLLQRRNDRAAGVVVRNVLGLSDQFQKALLRRFWKVTSFLYKGLKMLKLIHTHGLILPSAAPQDKDFTVTPSPSTCLKKKSLVVASSTADVYFLQRLAICRLQVTVAQSQSTLIHIMHQRLFPLIILALSFVVDVQAAGPRVLHADATWIVLGGKAPTSYKFNINAAAGETLTIAITEGNDDVGDQGVSWHLDSLSGQVISKGFTREKKKVTWTVKLPSSNPILILDDRDTNKGDPKKAGNGLKLLVTASGTAPAAKPATKPAPGKFDNYFGGPKAWYDSGKQLGKADREANKKPTPAKYSDHYDKVTEAEFRRGYMDAFK